MLNEFSRNIPLSITDQITYDFVVINKVLPRLFHLRYFIILKLERSSIISYAIFVSFYSTLKVINSTCVMLNAICMIQLYSKSKKHEGF